MKDMDIELTIVPVYEKGIKTRNEKFGLLVISKHTPILTMNDDSMAIWNLIDGHRNVGSIISSLQKEYDCSAEELKQAVIDFLNNCYKIGLIKFL